MSQARIYSAMLLLSLTAGGGSACSDGSFAGASSKEKKAKSADETAAAAIKTPSNKSTSGSSDQTTDDTSAKEIADTTNSSTKTKTTAPTPTPNTTDSANNTAPFQPIATDTTSQTTSKEIVFGSNTLFHIGDNDAGRSDCKNQLKAYAISGRRYFFNFDVLKDNTTINVLIGTVCGVDYDSSVVVLLHDTQQVLRKPLPSGARQLTLPQQTLAAGHYSVEVISGQDDGDADDFVVGDLHITGSGDIKAGQVGAN